MQFAMFGRVAAIGAVSALTFAGVGAATTGPAWAASSKVSVVHGIPGTPVDVYVDGERAIDDFRPGTQQGPVDLPAGVPAYDG